MKKVVENFGEIFFLWKNITQTTLFLCFLDIAESVFVSSDEQLSIEITTVVSTKSGLVRAGSKLVQSKTDSCV